MPAKPTPTGRPAQAEIVILMGGLSSRMGRDKARIRAGGLTLAGRARRAALQTGLAVKVLRRDCVPRCGPLGGLYTGLVKARRPWVLFLACDMPLVSHAFLNKVIQTALKTSRPVFTTLEGRPGFPLAVPKKALPRIRGQIERGRFALHALALLLKPKRLSPSPRERGLFLNVNRPEDLIELRRALDRAGPRVRRRETNV